MTKLFIRLQPVSNTLKKPIKHYERGLNIVSAIVKTYTVAFIVSI